MTFETRLRQALSEPNVHKVLHKLESVIASDLERLEATKKALSGDSVDDPPSYQTGPPRSKKEIAVSSAMRLALKNLQRRRSSPEIRRWERKKRLTVARSRFLDSIDVPDEQIDFSTINILLPYVNNVEMVRSRFLESLEIAKTP